MGWSAGKLAPTYRCSPRLILGNSSKSNLLRKRHKGSQRTLEIALIEVSATSTKATITRTTKMEVWADTEEASTTITTTWEQWE